MAHGPPGDGSLQIRKLQLAPCHFLLCLEDRAMKKKAKNGNSFVDALDKDNQFAVLTKPQRIQILVRPRPNDLRKRGKRGWHLFGTVDSSADADRTLMDMVRKALEEMEAPVQPAVSDKPKVKLSKTTAKA
jgi:hypothetical protein